MLLSPKDVLENGLEYVNRQFQIKSEANNMAEFRKFYGSSPLDLAEIWFDLMHTTIEGACVDDKDKGDQGFKMFMVSHHFLWTYPKNASLLANTFDIPERYSRGEPIWRWVERIAALKTKKIVWDPRLDDPKSEKFPISIDGTDCRTNEKKHPTLSMDPGVCSMKFKHAALKYEIALSVYRPKCVWVNGPFRGGMHDIDMFRAGLKARMPAGKRAIVDRGYRTTERDEMGMFTYPDNMDSRKLGNFKSRARLRHETFNGRLKKFNILSQTYRHPHEKHKFAFEAIVVIVQYQMDNGAPIFAV